MTNRLLIVLMNTDPRNVEQLATPFYHAAVAAALDHQVDVVCTSSAGRLLIRGVAEKLKVKADHPKTVYDWMKEAVDQGAKLWACPANLDLIDADRTELIPECAGLMSVAAMMKDIMGDACRVLTY